MNKDCGKEFLYAAKKTVTNQIFPSKPPNEYTGIGDFTLTPTTLESHVCPFCQSLEIAEVEKTEPAIESIISINIPEADEWIKKGYEVKDTYATKVTLVKKAKETEKQ
jgi:hypothetical protein